MKIVSSALALMLISGTAWSYDGDQSLSFPKFKRENFMDISAYRYRKQMDLEWQATDNGFRIAGGSLGPDLLYSDFEFKYRTHINSFIEFRLNSRQESFYSTKPTRYHLEIGARPLDWLYLSLLGMPTYDKRNSDMGSAIEIGHRPNNYVRFSYLRHDLFFNEKNVQDNAHYVQTPNERQLETVISFRDKIKLSLNLVKDSQSNKRLATDLLGKTGSFTHAGESGELTLDYQLTPTDVIGLSTQGFKSDKHLAESNKDQQQRFEYFSIQSYYLFPLQEHEITLGIRHDQLDYNTQDNINTAASVKRYFDTSQIYGIFLQTIEPWLNIEYALHLGKASLRQDFYQQTNNKDTNAGRESKFRFGIELLSPNKDHRLMFNTNWNLDHLQGQYWDGGHISFQGHF